MKKFTKDADFLDTYINMCKRTMSSHKSDNQLHCAIGVATEAGELLDAYKKSRFMGKTLDEVNIEEEIGDLFWYLFNTIEELKLNPKQIMTKNIVKLTLNK